jgi:hypothetical protein
MKTNEFLIALCLCALGLMPVPGAAQTRILVDSDGSSLPSISCPVGSMTGTVTTTDGQPAPSIEISWGHRMEPYTLPGLSVGQVLHATIDMKIDGNQAYPLISFGTPAADCDPNHRMTLPYIQYLPHLNLMYVYTTDAYGNQYPVTTPYTMPVGVWVALDFTFTPNEGGYYDYVLKMDGDVTLSGSSYEPLGINEQLAVAIGIGSGYNRDIIRYDNIKVELIDSCTGPTISDLNASPSILWPPNKKMVPVSVFATISGGCGAASCQIIEVTSNELPDADGDWQITGALSLKLRADRMGKGKGRVYTITVQCIDSAGNSEIKAVTVTVPHDRGK